MTRTPGLREQEQAAGAGAAEAGMQADGEYRLFVERVDEWVQRPQATVSDCPAGGPAAMGAGASILDGQQRAAWEQRSAARRAAG